MSETQDEHEDRSDRGQAPASQGVLRLGLALVGAFIALLAVMLVVLGHDVWAGLTGAERWLDFPGFSSSQQWPDLPSEILAPGPHHVNE